MGSIFRSEEMALAQLFIQPEAAYYSLSQLGEIGTVQFRDLNENVNALQRKFVNEVYRCDYMMRQIRYIESEIRKDGVAIPDCKDIPKAPNPRDIINLEARLEKTEKEIREFSKSGRSLKERFLELTEMKYVLEKMTGFFNQRNESSESSSWTALNFVAGVIKKERVPAFEQMLFRISKGNVFLRQCDIAEPLEDPISGVKMTKTVFAAFFQGDQLQSRVKKVCVGFRTSLYNCPTVEAEQLKLTRDICARLEDLKLVLNQTTDHRRRVLVSVANELRAWDVMVKKMTAIYHALNMFNLDVSKKCLIGECWLPISDRDKVQKSLANSSVISGSSIPSFFNFIDTTQAPPTFYRVNKFTEGFQNLIDAYGFASYREVNPALYTIITYPFLFAVMFGDIGHALIVLAFAVSMILAEKKTNLKEQGEIFRIFYSGRYICLLMAIFSVYTGIIYNDMFSKSFNVFSSSWFIDQDTIDTFMKHKELEEFELNPDKSYYGYPYPMGIDPAWQFASNKLIFLNSVKMKLSIIFGVVHMIFGVSLSLVNHIYFRKISSIFLEFLPQLLFLIFLFLWLVVMIFLKWILYAPNSETKFGSACAPSVLIYFINMVLLKSSPVPKDCDEYMFDGQYELQMTLLVLALLCVPVMLFGKPIHIMMNRKKKLSQVEDKNGNAHESAELQSPTTSSPDFSHDSDDKPMSEILIDQGIHTVEYVLSTVSHTASYLRLWALSLAHAQLSEVAWSMIFGTVLMLPLPYGGSILLFLAFAFWACCTVAILVLMEGLSAFLHTLRLHWVEFMSKFYSGIGYPFQPFCFNTLINMEENEEQ